MPRAIGVVPAGQDRTGKVVDTLILNFEQRQSPRGTAAGVHGTPIEFALGEPMRLRNDDCLVLDDGGLIEILAQPEPLLEARAADLATLARLAWHLGDRHVAVELSERRLRMRRDAAIEKLLVQLGAKVAAIEAPFEPESGAYAHGHAQHSHVHDPALDSHGHDHHHRGAHHHPHRGD